MPTKTLPDLVAKALAAGLDAATPAVAVARATRADERVIGASIAKLPERLAAETPSGPIVVMIGRVFADLAENNVQASNKSGLLHGDETSPRITSKSRFRR
jgi:uroporphyrin-III C-methyltransferase / precorrin-2 dehydrogenase / sirohydrochlorin ferrochelatase